ncbi:peroxisomal targeting signal 2 receptor [Pleodorina starrii]|uniref:Peroxin-7 n=1 Tax=Pleodorina starrii TaxID=330485 RepID=A0A9W6F4Y4_9CHLO|nr:peroxisomal targeting signal 2 receptor [Pleodorina starrii]GLC55831.1 peroxisomal targeting signal 2 receptor [Pleodorina starrii]GLC63817.1 peroxisomal targeting signal 2 receptor [Pleodorina starrii]
MGRCRTAFNAYSVKFSPFFEGRIAVATAQNFGIIGNGKQHVFEVAPNGAIVEVAQYDTQDGLYDCAWSEANENVLVASSGDGSIKVYDTALPPASNPVRGFKEHRHECCSLAWNPSKRDLFLSSSWDDTVKLWTLQSPSSLRTFAGHTYCVYHVAWNPQQPEVFLSASGDTTVRVWDLRQPAPTLVLPAHGFEVLAADWCKYNDCLLATGSVDKSIKLWDVRVPNRELAMMMGHSYAVRRVLFSPHSANLLLSCSYDMTVKLWDTASPQAAQGLPLRSWDHHTEFAVGIDFSTLREGMVASAGWDESVWVWDQRGFPSP